VSAVDRAALAELLQHLPDDVAGHVLDSGAAEMMCGPRDDGYRAGLVMSWLEEDGGQRPTAKQMDAIVAAINAAPGLLAELDAAEAPVSAVHRAALLRLVEARSDEAAQQLRDLLAELAAAERERDQALAALAVAERWLRTLAVNPTLGCPHSQWANEAQGDIEAAAARLNNGGHHG
jgi:hypothetical protein